MLHDTPLCRSTQYVKPTVVCLQKRHAVDKLDPANRELVTPRGMTRGMDDFAAEDSALSLMLEHDGIHDLRIPLVLGLDVSHDSDLMLEHDDILDVSHDSDWMDGTSGHMVWDRLV